MASEALPAAACAPAVNGSGPASQPLLVQTNPVLHKPMTLDTRSPAGDARRAQNGDVTGEREVRPPTGRARCDAANPFLARPT
jgi:hypothetical protein